MSFFSSYFRLWFDSKDESSINTIIMLMENSKIEFHTRRCERQWRRVCARAVFAWKSLKIFLITFSRFSIGITKESTLHWKICRNAARRRKLFPHIFEFSAHRRKLNRFIFIIIIIISSHSLQSTHKREISICRFIIGREKFFAESFPFSLSDFEVSCFPPHTMLILLWHFYIENFPSTISDFSRHHTYIESPWDCFAWKEEANDYHIQKLSEEMSSFPPIRFKASAISISTHIHIHTIPKLSD